MFKYNLENVYLLADAYLRIIIKVCTSMQFTAKTVLTREPSATNLYAKTNRRRNISADKKKCRKISHHPYR